MQQEPEQKEELLPDQGEDYGGPVKPFLEHLEDLRWMLIRVVVAVLVGMLVCLVASNRIVRILKAPLDRAYSVMDEYNGNKREKEGGGTVFLQFGTNVWKQGLSSNDFQPFANGDTKEVAFRLTPILVGTNSVLSLVPAEKPEGVHLGGTGGQLVNLGPLEGFRVAIQVALYGGVALGSPFILLFVGQFVLPALKRNEKSWLYQAVSFGGGLFAIGVLFSYYVLLPVVIMAAVQFSNWLGFGADVWRSGEYIGTVCKLMLGMGLGFELPVVILTLVKIGLLDYETMRNFRSYFVVINLVLSAFIMPPDGLTMFVMAIPLQLLFEISLQIARVWSRRDKAEASG